MVAVSQVLGDGQTSASSKLWIVGFQHQPASHPLNEFLERIALWAFSGEANGGVDDGVRRDNKLIAIQPDQMNKSSHRSALVAIEENVIFDNRPGEDSRLLF